MEHFTVHHFSQANPEGPGRDSVPALLRRVADTLESMGPVEVQDVVFHQEVTDDGFPFTATVYYHLPETAAGADPVPGAGTGS